MQSDTHTEILYGVNIPTHTEPMQTTSGFEKVDEEYDEKWGKKRNQSDRLRQCKENASQPVLTQAALGGHTTTYEPSMELHIAHFRDVR